MSILSHILQHKLIAIVRGGAPEDFPKIAEALHQGGITMIEVTLNSKDALKVIHQAAHHWKGKILIGAGTVLDADSASAAISAGARFILSPHLDQEIIAHTRDEGAVSIPGALTPTEILKAHRYGADIVKVFPASAGPGYFKDLRGPLSHIRLMPTGGVNLTNIQSFREAGAVAYGVGSALVDTSRPLTDDSLQEIKDRAHQFVHLIRHAP